MKKFLVLGFLGLMCACTTVDSGYEAPIVSYGETDMTKVLGEGVHWGLSYLWVDTPDYEIRNKPLIVKSIYFDNNNMKLPVTIAIYYNPIKGKTNYLHKNVGPDYQNDKLKALIDGALAKTIPQYSAEDLNIKDKAIAEKAILRLLQAEAKKIYVEVTDVQFSHVGIPDEVAEQAKRTAVQIGKNELATKMEAEKVSIAKAKVAEAQGNYDAGILNAKTQDLLSQPRMLEKLKIDNERIMWEGFKEHGHSPFGENNIFGQTNPTMLLNRK